MSKYVILCKGIEDLTGAPRYVNNKCRYLKEHGWDVLVFWSYDIRHAKLPHLLPFNEKIFIFHELQFYPCWFTKEKQNKVIDSIANRIGAAEEIVIESNKLQLGAWGEMLAKKIKAKHINFVTTEKLIIRNKPTFDYCYSKLQRHEFFTISPSAVKHLFSNYLSFEKPEDYYWSAMQGVEVEERDFPAFDRMGKADYTITSFGRTKGYFPYMLEELKAFIINHPGEKFNIFFLGDIINQEQIKEKLDFANVNLVIHPQAVEIVPRQIFTQSDLVIATAGCAALAAKYGGKVISMDVNRNVPLGYLGYTTLDHNTYSGKYLNDSSLSEWLQRLLIDIESFEPLEQVNLAHDFDYQMQYVIPSDGHYVDSSKVNEKITRYDMVYSALCKIGFWPIVEHLFYRRKKKRFSKNWLKNDSEPNEK